MQININKLSDIADINPSKYKRAKDDYQVGFIPMEYVDDITGQLINYKTVNYSDVSKGYTSFKNNDVVFAKITPCMENGKCAVIKNMPNGVGFGSTEFYVIRPKENILPEYIWFYLRQERIRKLAVKSFTGSSGHKRVSKNFVDNLSVPIPFIGNTPSISDQKRVILKLEKILDEVDKAIIKTNNAIKDSKDLFFSELENTIGTKCNYEEYSFIEKANIFNGFAFKSTDYKTNGIPLIRIGNVQDNYIDLGNCKYLPKEYETKYGGFVIKDGDLLIALSGATTGKVGRYLNKSTVLLNQRVGKLVVKEDVSLRYVYYFLLSRYAQNQVKILSIGAAQPNLTNRMLEQMKIKFPTSNNKLDLKKQEVVASKLDKLYQLEKKKELIYSKQLSLYSQLRQSLLNKAFQGKL
jgi:type I restriction enzyme S subunit